MQQPVETLLLSAITRIPEWVRHDLVSKDPVARLRAEETLAAMLVDALAKRSEAS